jgi:multimeric flavodoxin WrbA
MSTGGRSKTAATLKAVALIGTLQTGEGLTNTLELTRLVSKHLDKFGVTMTEFRLANLALPPGTEEQIADKKEKDDYPRIAKAMREADIVIFATPIWWGQHSSLIQRVLERMTHFDERYIETGRSELYHKVAGVVVTGHEDGAQHILGNIFSTSQWFGFVIPPECMAYWVGEVGGSMTEDPDKRRASPSTNAMAAIMARNLANYARLLRDNRSALDAFEKAHPARVGTRGGTYVQLKKVPSERQGTS